MSSFQSQFIIQLPTLPPFDVISKVKWNPYELPLWQTQKVFKYLHGSFLFE